MMTDEQRQLVDLAYHALKDGKRVLVWIEGREKQVAITSIEYVGPVVQLGTHGTLTHYVDPRVLVGVDISQPPLVGGISR
jgi:hypothetical protein